MNNMSEEGVIINTDGGNDYIDLTPLLEMSLFDMVESDCWKAILYELVETNFDEYLEDFRDDYDEADKELHVKIFHTIARYVVIYDRYISQAERFFGIFSKNEIDSRDVALDSSYDNAVPIMDLGEFYNALVKLDVMDRKEVMNRIKCSQSIAIEKLRGLVACGTKRDEFVSTIEKYKCNVDEAMMSAGRILVVKYPTEVNREALEKIINSDDLTDIQESVVEKIEYINRREFPEYDQYLEIFDKGHGYTHDDFVVLLKFHEYMLSRISSIAYFLNDNVMELFPKKTELSERFDSVKGLLCDRDENFEMDNEELTRLVCNAYVEVKPRHELPIERLEGEPKIFSSDNKNCLEICKKLAGLTEGGTFDERTGLFLSLIYGVKGKDRPAVKAECTGNPRELINWISVLVGGKISKTDRCRIMQVVEFASKEQSVVSKNLNINYREKFVEELLGKCEKGSTDHENLRLQLQQMQLRQHKRQGDAD